MCEPRREFLQASDDGNGRVEIGRLLAPPVAILGYYGLQRLRPGIEPWILLLPVALITSGAWQFTQMRRSVIADRRSP